ncbi:MAG: hypothetical protein ACK448_01410 [Bacteroidota bacterium]
MTAHRLANRTIIWQGVKAVLAILVVVLYSRMMGAAGRGHLSIWLMNIQLFMLVLEWMVGSTLPNFMIQYGVKRTLRFSIIVSVGVSAIWMALHSCWIWINKGALPLTELSLVFGGGTLILLLSVVNVVLGFYQFKGLVEKRNQLQISIELLKLLLLMAVLAFIAKIIVVGPLQGLGLLGLIWIAPPVLSTESVSWVLVFSLVIAVLVSIFLNRKLWWIELRNDAISENGLDSENCGDSENSGEVTLPEEKLGKVNSENLGLKAFSFLESNRWILPRKAFSDGFWSQAGHLVYFAITRAPLWALNMWSADKSIIGVLANVWLMWDTLMVIANSYGVVIHSMALQPSSENIRGVLGQFIRKSFVRSLLVCLVVSVIPDDVFSSIFGWEFSNMNRYFILIVPTILLSAICSPIAHWLHATNRFFELFRIYLSAVIVYVSFIVFGLFFPGIVYCIKLNVKGFIEELFSNRSFYSSDLVVVNWEVVALFPAFFCMFLLLLRSLRRTE